MWFFLITVVILLVILALAIVILVISLKVGSGDVAVLRKLPGYKPHLLYGNALEMARQSDNIDECAQGSHNCLPSFASCMNTAGSYNCSCNHGYTGDGKTSCGLDTQECQNYQSLSSADRKVTNRVSVQKKDKELGPGWFRFEGSAGTRMASSCPHVYMCGTHATGWMCGSHPTVAGGTVNRKVCFHWSGNCCNWSTNIQVRNCGSYYVYYLSGTPFNLGNLRYCGSD